MHRHHAAEGFQLIRRAGRFEPDNHADPAKSVGDRIVHVACDHAFAGRHRSCPPQRHVLADLGDGLVDSIGNRAIADTAGEDFIDIGAGGQRHIGDHLHQALEQIIARYEVGFRIDFDNNAFVRRERNADQAFRRDPPGFLGGLCKPLFAQPVDRGFKIAAGFPERCLAVHHAGPGFVAELFHHACGDVRHFRSILVVPASSFRGAPLGASSEFMNTAPEISTRN